MPSKTTVDLSGFGAMARALRGPRRRKAMLALGRAYLSYIQRRYRDHSMGDGDWQPLAQSTIAARRQGSTAMRANNAQILRDRGLLFAALGPGHPAQRMEARGWTIAAGYRPVRHGSDEATYSGIADRHQRGRGVPQREIFTNELPPQEVTTMRRILQRQLTQQATGR